MAIASLLYAMCQAHASSLQNRRLLQYFCSYELYIFILLVLLLLYSG